MSRILVVTVEPPWPANHGGRIRTARIAEAIACHHDVVVTFPDHGDRDPRPPVPALPLPFTPAPALRTRASSRPHLGGHYLMESQDRLAGIARDFRPDTVYWSHSYLAPWAPDAFAGVPKVIEFANIESKRLQTLAAAARGTQRAVRHVEAWKSRRWEPQAAASAALCVTLNEHDADALNTWSRRVLVVPNGVDPLPYEPSPIDAYALALASYDYEPNVAAIRRVVRDVWPQVISRNPAARLVIAGRRSESLAAMFAGVEGVEVAGTLDQVAPSYAGAAMTLALATTGGGSQLKVTESLSRGRCAVLSPFAAAGVAAALRDSAACLVAESDDHASEHIVRLLTDAPNRWAREREVVQRCAALTWSAVTAPLNETLSYVAASGGRA